MLSNVWFHKISITPHCRGSLKILGRGGGLKIKAKLFKEKYEPKLEFPEGWGSKPTKHLHGWSMDIFWKNTIVN